MTEIEPEITPKSAEARGVTRRARAAWRWALAPVALLGGLLGTQLVVLAQVLHDPGFALEHDYYQKAAGWDASRARQRKSDALGWNAVCGVTPVEGAVKVRVRLSDAAGRPITSAALHVSAFHNARAGRVFELSPSEREPGEYEAELAARQSGAWEFRISAVRAGDVFERTLRLDVNLGEHGS